MIKRLIEYLVTERRTKYIQYKSSSKSSSARDCTSYSTLKATSVRISTMLIHFNSNNLILIEINAFEFVIAKIIFQLMKKRIFDETR